MSVIQPCFKYASVWEFVIKSKKASFPNSLESFNTSHMVSYSYWSLSLEFDYKQLLFKRKKKPNQIKMLKKNFVKFKIKKKPNKLAKHMHTPWLFCGDYSMFINILCSFCKWSFWFLILCSTSFCPRSICCRLFLFWTLNLSLSLLIYGIYITASW